MSPAPVGVDDNVRALGAARARGAVGPAQLRVNLSLLGADLLGHGHGQHGKSGDGVLHREENQREWNTAGEDWELLNCVMRMESKSPPSSGNHRLTYAFELRLSEFEFAPFRNEARRIDLLWRPEIR